MRAALERIDLFKMPRRSQAYLLLWTVGALAFVLLSIYPSHKHMVGVERELQQLNDKVEEQRVLFPIYEGLLKKIWSSRVQSRDSRTRVRLTQNQMNDISGILEDVAQRHNFEVISTTPDVKSMAKNPGYLLVAMVVRGKFLDFRQFLLELAGLPFLEHIEGIQIQEITDTKEFTLKLWLSVE